MPFILNNNRKPKAAGRVFLKTSESTRINEGFRSSKLREALRNKISMSEISKFFSADDLKVLKDIAYTYQLNGTNKKVCLMYGSYDHKNKGYECSVYVIDVNNIILKDSKFNEYGVCSDTVAIDPKAWFNDEEVYNTDYTLFFDKVSHGLVAAIHPKDLEECKKNDDLVFIGEVKVSGEGETPVLSHIGKLTVLRSSDREKKEIEKRNSQRLIGDLKVKPSHDNIAVSYFAKDGKSEIRAVELSNIEKEKIDKLGLGKYRLFLTKENKEVWFVISRSVVLGKEQKDFGVFEVDTGNKYLEELPERKPLRFLKKS